MRCETYPEDPTNYENRYPTTDVEGEELSENARVWRVHNDEAREYDREMVQGWREGMDMLLLVVSPVLHKWMHPDSIVRLVYSQLQ